MSYKDFHRAITSGQLKSLYYLYGPEQLMIERMINQLVNDKLNKEFIDFNYIVKDADTLSFDEAMSIVERLPIMDTMQIVVIKPADTILINAWSEREIERFIEYHTDRDALITILWGEKIDKRKSVFKMLKSVGDAISFDRLDEVTLCKWMIQETAKMNVIMSMSIALELSNRLGYLHRDSTETLYHIESLLTKLCHGLSTNQLERSDIAKVLDQSLEANIFKLIDALFAQKSKLAYRQLNVLIGHGEVPIKISFMIQRHIRQLFSIKLLLDKGYSTTSIADKLKLKAFVVKKAQRQLTQLDNAKLVQMINWAIDCDLQTKSSLDGRIAIEMLMANILGALV